MIRSIRHPRGFTFVELMLAIGITSLVMAAIASLTFAAATQWRSSDNTQAVSILSTKADGRLESLFRGAKLIGLVRTGGSISSQSATPACAMVWIEDTNLDKAMQVSEMALLQYESATQTLKLYRVQWPAGWTTAQKTTADVIMATTDLNSSDAPEDFKELNYVTGVTLLKNVTAASFCVPTLGSTTELQKLDVVLQLLDGNTKRTRYYSITLRAPNRSPSATPVL
jgi:prepilin-type N-terminal cleavage/methylation domain-containing protein